MTRALEGRIAVVTGAGSGFGAGIARAFADAGATVWVADVNDSAGIAVADALGGHFFHLDICDSSAVAAFAASLNHVDILVNNAGIGHTPQPAEDLPADVFNRVVDVNMRGIYHTTAAFVPGMKTRRRGVIVNIASTAGVRPRGGLTWYNASKGWVITATKSLAAELAPFGIRVNAINPVAGETPLLATFMGGDTSANRERFLATIPLGRFCTPEDVGAAACYLASDGASMVTGVALEVDGGRVL
ncbi:MAG: glucose 1-dehydrogenase [Pseudomonadales bacterium]|nr:glucose 1-dehydrogenase [Pseudomonadales bacterium]MCP5183861.1 glucose 1-dehydrogenase [Pseudomonadales bacterium]